MYYLILPLTIIITACSTTQGSNEFYTWVDEGGNLHTQRISNKSASQSKMNFDPAEYTPSVELDKKLNNTKLYAWQSQDGKQMVIESGENIKTRSSSKAADRLDRGMIFKAFREGFQYQYSELKGRELLLADYYRFNETENFDYFIINLDEPVSSIVIKFFIMDQLIAQPEIIPLNEFYEQRYGYDLEWGKMVEESWSGYGYLESQLLLPEDTQYLLILPSENIKPIILGNNIVKINNLGSIVIKSLD